MIAITALRAICSPKVGPIDGRVEAVLPGVEAELAARAAARPRGPGSGGILAWIWTTLSPNSGFSVSWILAESAPSMPPSTSASRTSSTLAGSLEGGLDPGPRLEVDAEVELLGREGDRADREDHARDREEPPARLR